MKQTLFAILMSLMLLTPLPAQDSASRLEKLWADLSDRNETTATRAALALAAMPKEAVPFLAQKLKPLRLEPAAFQGLVKNLDSDDFETREQAFQELAYFGKVIRPELERVLETKPTAEVRNQVTRLLEAARGDDPLLPAEAPKIQGRGVQIQNNGGQIKIIIDGKQIDLAPKIIEKPGPRPAWLRAARANAVLEHIGTPDAVAILKAMAAGEADLMPSKSAQEAINRLNK